MRTALQLCLGLMLAVNAMAGGEGGDTKKPRAAKPKLRKVSFLGVVVVAPPDALRQHLKLPQGVGLSVAHVVKGSPAGMSLKRGDVITKWDDQLLVVPEQVKTLVRLKQPGDQVKLTVFRRGRKLTIPVVLGSTLIDPAKEMTAWSPKTKGQPEIWPDQIEINALKTEQINKIYNNRHLSNQEKTDKINHLLEDDNVPLQVDVTDKGLAIRSTTPAEPEAKPDRITITGILQDLPPATRKRLQRRIKRAGGKVEVVQTPRGVVIITFADGKAPAPAPNESEAPKQ